MASVNVYSVGKIDELIADDVIGATITDGHLILQLRDGGNIDVGDLETAMDDASVTNKGLIELATDAETIEGIDGERAVTPLGLSSLTSTDGRRGLVELATNTEAVTGTDTTRAITPANLLATKIVSNPGESATPSSYPPGNSSFRVDSSDWSLNGGSGLIQTTKADDTAAKQVFNADAGGTEFPRTWVREYHSTNGGGGWTEWQETVALSTLDAASFTQATPISSYPIGMSRIYFDNTSSSTWDFSGKWGEITTYRDGGDYNRQMFVEHIGGAGLPPQMWIRTANGGSGWSSWTKIDDTGYLTLTMTGGGSFSVKRDLKYRRKNGMIYVKGALTVPSGGFTTFATLPSGFRPPENRQFPITTNASIYMALQINTDGTVQSWSSGATTAWFSIDGAFFFLD